MNKPIILIGDRGSGKTTLARAIAGIFPEKQVAFMDFYTAATLRNFLKEDRAVIRCLVIEAVPDETSLKKLYYQLKGIAIGTGIEPQIIFCTQDTGILPGLDFTVLTCSYNLYHDKHFSNYEH